ncbi:succinate dehydrogenase, cytochrome b556 subunit [Geoglobus ahangari]|uniref:Succinate dehydrogenase, cytochrome b556 subunit n=1 Tax=Geoglobus ahangari TaxID=113653 RepID=A0A0F7IGT2_9EURY|nr:succinate dehydrogenase, cytochrome b556 subunit [Geoglobus ahangari]AKG91887.1 succinate dehydrogenase, cytochrome b556 subunit [Geoglobus ahangari]
MSESHTRRVLEPFGWIFQMITGLLLFAFVIFHLYITHLTSHDALEYAKVVERLSNPAIKAFYWLFLASASFHAFNGLRAILLDTDFGGRNERAVNAMTMLLFLIAVVYGGLLLITF